MQANLKKIKLEVGGDLLLLAMVRCVEFLNFIALTFFVVQAKSDGITSLQRFRNKSEPTWMFVSVRVFFVKKSTI